MQVSGRRCALVRTAAVGASRPLRYTLGLHGPHWSRGIWGRGQPKRVDPRERQVPALAQIANRPIAHHALDAVLTAGVEELVVAGTADVLLKARPSVRAYWPLPARAEFAVCPAPCDMFNALREAAGFVGAGPLQRAPGRWSRWRGARATFRRDREELRQIWSCSAGARATGSATRLHLGVARRRLPFPQTAESACSDRERCGRRATHRPGRVRRAWT
jgi:hypothetical protein